MRAKDIFTPGRFPKWTYIDTHLKKKEEHLRDALDDGSMLVSISGPSKSGKTVFVQHVLGRDDLIPVTGAGVESAQDLWLRVFDIIGTPVGRTATTSSSQSGATKATGSLEGNAIVAKGKGSTSISKKKQSAETESTTEAVDYLQLLIKELSGTSFVVLIDDFHYIPREVQSEIAQHLKEAIRQGVKVICASVPYHKDDVIRSNPDLRGRIFSIDFDYWATEILKQIAYKGFDTAHINYSSDLVNSLAEESTGSPQLMQYLCLNCCFELGVREVPEAQVDLNYESEFFESVCRRTVLSTDYGSVVENMVEGPKTRGSDRNVYITKYGWQGDVYKLLVKALSVDPPRLTFRYQPLVDRVSDLCNDRAPSGSSVTSACHHVANIANTTQGDNVVEWDPENDVFDIRDPYLLFYLRWSESL